MMGPESPGNAEPGSGPAGNPFEQLEDEALIGLCQENGGQAPAYFRELVRRYEPLVIRICRRYLQNPEEAEDACQDIFLRVFRHLADFQGRSSFRTWLYRVVYNACETRRVRLRAHAAAKAEEAEAESAGEMAADSFHADRLNRALIQIDPEERNILLLRFISGLSIAEIAETLAIGLSAAKMRLYRATDRFREVYQEIEKEDA